MLTSAVIAYLYYTYHYYKLKYITLIICMIVLNDVKVIMIILFKLSRFKLVYIVNKIVNKIQFVI